MSFKIFYIQLNLNGLTMDDWFTMANSNSFWVPTQFLPIVEEKYFGNFSNFIMKLQVVCTHSSCLIKAIQRSTHNIQLLCIKKISINNRYLLPDLAP